MRLRRGLACGALALIASACVGGTADTTLPSPFPPHERQDLAALFDPMVAPLGYHVTRAALIDRSTYEVDPAGSHLAVYLAPDSDTSYDQFAADFPGLVRVFLPEVFDRWPGLHSFDVCQEPFASTQDPPPSLTIIDLTRDGAAGVDWTSTDLAGLIALNDREGISVWAGIAVRDSVTWRQAAGSG